MYKVSTGTKGSSSFQVKEMVLAKLRKMKDHGRFVKRVGIRYGIGRPSHVFYEL